MIYGSGVALNCGVGCRRGLDPALLWLWHRLAAAVLIRPLAWEPLYAIGAALKKKKKQIFLKRKLSQGSHLCTPKLDRVPMLIKFCILSIYNIINYLNTSLFNIHHPLY